MLTNMTSKAAGIERLMILLPACMLCGMLLLSSAPVLAVPIPLVHYSLDAGTYNLASGTVDDVAVSDIGNNQIQQFGSGVSMGIPGVSGEAAYFDGGYASGGGGGSDNVFLKAPTSQLEPPGRDKLYGMSALTLSAWVLPTRSGFRSPWGSSRDVVRVDNSVFANPTYGLIFTDLGNSAITVAFVLTTEGAGVETNLKRPMPGDADDVFFDGKWHMIAGVYDGSKMQLYWDGLPLGAPLAKTGRIAPIDNHALEIGNFPFAETFEPFRGAIDEVKIYNTALTADQILQEYSSTVPEPSGLLVILMGVSTAGAAICRRRGA